MTAPVGVVVIGPAGCGKSTVGSALAGRLGGVFLDADDHHPPANVAKMTRGIPLDDTDRAPWLDRLVALVESHGDDPRPFVLACSALRRVHRVRLGLEADDLAVVYLDVPEAVLAHRLRNRPGHFARVDLLASQLATLEAPGPDEALRVDGTAPVATLVDQIADAFALS